MLERSPSPEPNLGDDDLDQKAIELELDEIIDATPTGHLALLVTKTGKSYSANDFSGPQVVR